MYFQLYIPAGIWGIILISLLILISHTGLFVFDYWFKTQKVKHNNEVAGIIFAVLTLIYSLIVAFVIVAVWENYEDLNQTIQKEADDLNSVLVHSNIFPDSLKQPISHAIKAYCEKVINNEWDMAKGPAHYEGSAIPSLRVLLFKVEASNKVQENVLTIMDSNLSEITNLHRDRLNHTHAYVPQLVWMILTIGSVMVIVFSYFLYMESFQLKRIFLSFLWCIIGMSLFLVYMLDHPFVGSTQVSKAPYEAILANLLD